VAADTSLVTIRMRDVVASLWAAGQRGESLNRIRLQKFVYLMDAVATLFRLLPPSEGHYTFKYGPFDPAVQNAVDCLAFRGLVKILNLKRGDEGTLSVDYTLTEAGQSWARELASVPVIADRLTIAEAVALRVSRLGWRRLRELVYAEPTFVSLAGTGYGRRLHPEQGKGVTSARLLEIISAATSRASSETRHDLTLDLYFGFLHDYAHRQKPGRRVHPMHGGGA